MDDLTNDSTLTGLEVAIIGMACRFPGAEGVERFWENLRAGVESITHFTDEELLAAGERPELVAHPSYVKVGRVIDDDDRFDANLFGFSPREAELVDPQQRMLLECGYQALEHAGYDSRRYPGLIGAFAGIKMTTYIWNIYANPRLLASVGDLNAQIANDKDYVATRLAYKLHLGGPTVTVQSACSTSLVGIHLGCQALLSGECDMALAGGVAVRTAQHTGYVYREGEILSPDGRCRPFDADARGTIFGNGLGMVVLKRLEEAIEDGDRIWAVIKGSAVNNDSSAKVGFTAPGADGQERVIRAAQTAAEVAPETIGYVEAHGTGTSVGDPIEMTALGRAFRSVESVGTCGLGSVKGNIGHLATAAGVAGVIKAALALDHREIPPSLLFERPNPQIDFASSPFRMVTELTPFEPGPAGVRRAAVSAFGIGGTNAHAILEEAPERAPSGPSRPWQLLLVSAKTASALETMTDELAAHLAAHPELPAADVAHTLQVGRQEHEHRRAVVARDLEQARRALEERDPKSMQTAVGDADQPLATFMFSGQGSQHAGMMADLYRHEAGFRQQVDESAALLEPVLDLDLRELLFPAADRLEAAGARLEQTAYAQPALFVVEHALARLWMSWGIEPVAMIGHSIGEYVAACLAGVLSLEDALRLVAARGRLMQSMPSGSMLAVSLSEEDLAPRLGKQLAVAAENGPERLVVSGPESAIADLEQRLAAEGVGHRRLHTSHAFHSRMMEPILAPFVDEVAKVELSAPQIPYVSNVTGTWVTDAQATDPAYWADHLASAVRFSDGLDLLFEEPQRVLLEVGPGQSLTTLARRHPAKGEGHRIFASARHPKATDDDQAFLLAALGRAWLAGLSVDWDGFYRDERRHRVVLPTYPFERQRYWIDAPADMMAALAERSSAARQELADWFYVPHWVSAAMPVPFAPAAAADEEAVGPWLVLAEPWAGDEGLGSTLARRLSAAGRQVAVAVPGDGFAERGNGGEAVGAGEAGEVPVFELDPTRGEDWDALFDILDGRELAPRRIVHLWAHTGTAGAAGGAGAPSAERLEELAFIALLSLGQALGRRRGGALSALDLALVTDGLHRVRGDEDLMAEKALLLGPCRVLPQEYPTLAARAVDVEAPADRAGTEALADLLIGELGEPVGRHQVIAYRDGQKLLQDLVPLHLERTLERALPFTAGGVYLVTGGLGGIGLALSELLAREAGAKLALLGRSPLPPRKAWEEHLASHPADDREAGRIRQVLALEELGAEVLVLAADVTDATDMERAVAEVVERFGTVHGVIHSAGVPGGGMVQLKDPEAARRVLAPKVRGARNLERALSAAGVEPELFVLCSSTIALLGNFGQVDYAAGNSFLDAFAHELAGRTGCRAVSINWGAWKEVGMAVAAAGGGRGEGQKASAQGPPTPPARPIHPLLDTLVRHEGATRAYRTVLTPLRHWTLEEHRISGTPALPGTSHLEIVRAAFEHATGEARAELRDVFFFTPLMVPEGSVKELEVSLEEHDGGFRFRTLSRDWGATGTKPRDHAMGWVGPADAAAATQAEPVDLEALRARCSKDELEVDASMLDRTEKLVYWGPRWQSLRRVHVGESEALALLELPAEFEAELSDYRLHPALLDVATAIGGSVAATEEGSYLPLSYGRLRLAGDLPRRFWSHVAARADQGASGETLVIDVRLLDAEGRPVVTIDGFSMKRVGGAAERLAEGGSAAAAMATGEGPSEATERSAPSGAGAEPGSDPIGEGLLQGAMAPAEGVEAFRRLLSRVPGAQVAVSPRDLPALLEELARSREPGEGAGVGTGAGDASRASHPRPSLSTALVEPRTELEKILTGVWQTVLGLDEVGVHDNFFELGGDSVLGIQVLARAREQGVELSSGQLFEHQTVAELAEALGSEPAAAGGAAPAPAVQVDEPFALARAAGVGEAELERLLARGDGDGAVEDVYPLTPLQEGLLFHSLEVSEEALYVEQVRLTVDEALDPEALEEAWRVAFARHPVLRTSFAWRELERPMQLVHREAPFEIVHRDLRGEPTERREELVLEAATAEASRPFDLERAPVMRLALFRVADERTVLVWSHHHLILDGWSSPQLFREIFTLYRQLMAGGEIALSGAEPVAGFRDYVAWLERRDPSGSERFWRSELAGFRRPTPIGSDRGADEVAGVAAETVREDRVLEPAPSAALETLARSRRVSLATVAQSLWALHLAAASGERDVVFGMSVSSRPAELPGVESMVGLFLNALPVRARLVPDRSLADWWRELGELQARILEHAETSLARVHEWSDVPREHPLFESIFEFWNFPLDLGGDQDGGSGVSGFHYDVVTNFPASLRVVPGGRLELQLSYDRHRFDDRSARRILDDLAALAVWVAEHPEATVGRALDRLEVGQREERAARAHALSGVAQGRLKGLKRRRGRGDGESAT